MEAASMQSTSYRCHYCDVEVVSMFLRYCVEFSFQYSELEVQKMIDMNSFLFKCRDCERVLVEV